MFFDQKKLPAEEGDSLHAYPVGDVVPYVPLWGPPYVFLKENRKFVAIKEPLDFFTPSDLERYAKSGNIYFPRFIDRIKPFERCARQVAALLDPSKAVASLGGSDTEPAPFEVSDAVARLLSKLWSASEGTNAFVEPFFLAAFAETFCGSLPPKALVRAREHSFASYELSLLRAAWVVFHALLLGCSDYAYLVRLRERVFETESLENTERLGPLADELVRSARWVIQANHVIEPIDTSVLRVGEDSALHRVYDRLDRVRFELQQSERPVVASVFGLGGLISTEVRASPRKRQGGGVG